MTARLIKQDDRNAVTLVLPDPGRRTLRMIFRDGAGLRAMCWFKVGSDGSLYFDHLIEDSASLTFVKGAADGKGGWTPLGPMTEVEIAQLEERGPKISQHASGLVRRATQRSHSINFRELTELTLVRQDDYAVPDRYKMVNEGELRVADIPVPSIEGGVYELDRARPLTSRLFVTPLDAGHAAVSVVEDDEVDAQTSVLVPATGLNGCRDLVFQLVFWNRAPRDWPSEATSGIVDAAQPGQPRPATPSRR